MCIRDRAGEEAPPEREADRPPSAFERLGAGDWPSDMMKIATIGWKRAWGVDGAMSLSVYAVFAAGPGVLVLLCVAALITPLYFLVVFNN